MSHSLLVDVDWAEGTLQRLIGLIERRGFEIVDIDMVRIGDVRRIEAIVRARSGERSFDILCRQVDRLYGIYRSSQVDASERTTDHQFPLVG